MSDPRPTKYQVRIFVPGYSFPPMSWNCLTSGRPSADNLSKFVHDFEASTQPGRANDHLGVTVVDTATINVNDGSSKVLFRYYKPAPVGASMFETVTEYHL